MNVTDLHETFCVNQLRYTNVFLNLYFISITYIQAPCGNEKCENTTDTCVNGKCQCGDSSQIVCDIDSEYPFCLSGSCGCSKIRGSFVAGDGSTRGSCFSVYEKCQSNGECKGCTSDAQCSGLSDTCTNNKCGCGTGPTCNSTISSHCLEGKCKCGESDQCSSSMYIEDGLDPRDGTFGIQRTDQEVCEKITEYYNPLFVPMHPLMKMKGSNGNTFVDTGFDEESTSDSYILEYDDRKGCRSHIGKYMCLGMILFLFYKPLLILSIIELIST